MQRPITEEAIDLIVHFEGFSEHPYLCQAGVPTIGIGTTIYPDGTKVTLDDPDIHAITAREYLMNDLKHVSKAVDKFLVSKSVLLNEQQYSVLVSFGYNVGLSPITQPGRSLCEAIKKDNPFHIADTLLLYNKVTKIKNGVTIKEVSSGLTRRRKAERHLFLNGTNNFYNT